MQSLLNLLSAVALLVWGTHIVRTGILRVYGAQLRRLLSTSIDNRFSAMLAGLGVTSLIQSSTATSLIATSFVRQGLIATAPALAIMLGADVGTGLMVQLFSFDLSWLSPLLILVGVVLYISTPNSTTGRIGRIAIGLGLIILSLQLIVLAARPITQAAGVKVIFASLTGDYLVDILVGAVFAILSYSSLAVVLLTATLAASGVVSVPVALCIVLGANLGSGILAILMTLKSGPEARRIPLGNFLFKLAGCIIALPLLGHLEQWLALLEPQANRQVVDFHLAFNLALLFLFIFATEPVARLVERLLPAAKGEDNPSRPRYLDPSVLGTPGLAIACAAREALRLGDTVEVMLKGVMTVLQNNDLKLAEALRRMDDVVDDLYAAIKFYLTQISHEALEDNESRRWTDIVSFAINMEHVGDIIERILIDVEEKKITRHLSFSEAGMAEICDLHAQLLANLQLGLSVFLNGDLKSAQRLLAQKDQFREREMAYADNHMKRLTENTRPSIETSSLHLDMLSDMKRINSHICSIAYPILESAGALHASRLRHPARAAAQAGSPLPLA